MLLASPGAAGAGEHGQPSSVESPAAPSSRVPGGADRSTAWLASVPRARAVAPEFREIQTLVESPDLDVALEIVPGQRIHIRLAPQSCRAEGSRVIVDAGGELSDWLPEAPRTLRSRTSMPAGWRFAGSQLDDGLHGLFVAPDGSSHWIQPAPGMGNTGVHLVYRSDDVTPPWATCGGPHVFDAAPDQPEGSVAGVPVDEICVAQLGCDADFQYFAYWGSVQAVVDRIELITAINNLQYKADVGIIHEITGIVVRTTPGLPYTSSVAQTLLSQFRDEWNVNQGSISRDVAQLFTGKDLVGTIIGLAWDLGVVCVTSDAYCLSQSDWDPALACATDLSAHELGHLWAGVHCACTSPPSTMNPTLTCANTFKFSSSIPTILDYRNSVGCLDCTIVDCNGNGIPDGTDIDLGISEDCNDNDVLDVCDLADYATDCNGDGVLDECTTGGDPLSDCDGDGDSDACELASGASADIDSNGVPDQCDPDCNGNGLPDGFDLQQLTSQDCNANGVPDECDIASGSAADCDGSGVPDSCEVLSGALPDCNLNGLPDPCEVKSGTAPDFDGNGVPDSCDPDCNNNGFPDGYDLDQGFESDCNGNRVPDSCESAGGSGPAFAIATDAATDGLQDLDPALAAAGGTWIAVWTRLGEAGGELGDDGDVLVARGQDGGVSWSPPTPLHASATSDAGADHAPRIATDGGGVWVAVWQSTTQIGTGQAGDADIHFVRSEDDGVTWSAQLALHPAATDNAADERPDVATDGSGVWVAAWSSRNELGGTIGTDFDILVARSIDGGANWLPPLALNSTASIDGDAPDTEPSVAVDGNGNWIVAWTTRFQPGMGLVDEEVVFSRSTDGGATWSAAAPLDPAGLAGGNADRSPRLAAAGSTVVAVWTRVESDAEVVSARSVDGGLTWSRRIELEPGESDDDYSPVVMLAGDGRAFAAWRSNGAPGAPLGTDADILVVRSSDGGATWSAPEPATGAALSDNGFDGVPAIATDGAGAWLVTWEAAGSISGLGADRDIVAVQLDAPDCNRNGVPDACDIDGGTSQDLDGDGIPDECQALFGDIDGNGEVDGADLGLLLGAWGGTGPADLDGSGTVDGADLGLLLGAWSG